MLDARPCNVKTSGDLDREIRDIFALDLVGRGDEICGTLHVHYENEEVKKAPLVPALEAKGCNHRLA